MKVRAGFFIAHWERNLAGGLNFCCEIATNVSRNSA